MDLEGKRKEQVASIAEQIADVALSNPVEAQSRRGVGGREPIPWRFRLLSPEESDSNTGIGIDVLVRDFGEPWESPQQLGEERLGYSEEFGRCAEEAAENSSGIQIIGNCFWFSSLERSQLIWEMKS